MMFRDKLENNKIFIAVISFFSLFRIYLGVNMPIWLFPHAVYDDILMLDYSHLSLHFTNWNIQSLSKDIMYPIFLYLVRLSHVSYRFWLSILWIFAAILLIYSLYNFLTKDKLILLGSFLFVLFLPIAFDIVCGQRVYRNAIITPTTIIFLTVLYIFINKVFDSSISISKTLMWGIFLGFIFTFNYYIKEDGILTIPILVVSIILIVLFKMYGENNFPFSKYNFKKFIKLSAICVIPLLIFMAGTLTYQEVNNHYFGVAEVNTRTSGQIGEFYANLLKIDDSNKEGPIWIPSSTVEKAVEASPTLRAHPELIDAWMDTVWNNCTLRDSTIRGDLTGWSLRTALDKVGLYNDEKSTNDFFFKVNNELNDAFENGQLEKSDKIFITSSANGKDINEIFDLNQYILYGFDVTFFYQGLEFNNVNHPNTSLVVSNDVTKSASQDLNDELISQTDLDNLSPLNLIPIKFMEWDLEIYHAISYLIVLIAFASFLLICINQYNNRFKDKKMLMLILFNILLFGTVVVQIFAVTWFCSFLGTNPWVGSMDDITTHVKFYLVSAYGFFTMFVILSIVGAYNIIENYELEE